MVGELVADFISLNSLEVSDLGRVAVKLIELAKSEFLAINKCFGSISI